MSNENKEVASESGDDPPEDYVLPDEHSDDPCDNVYTNGMTNDNRRLEEDGED